MIAIGYLDRHEVAGLFDSQGSGDDACATCYPCVEPHKSDSDKVPVCLASDALSAALDVRAKAAAVVDLSSQDILLTAGEMTRQELRTVKAVLAFVKRKIVAMEVGIRNGDLT